MVHPRSQHPNAVLTPRGRRRMVGCVIENGWTVEQTAERFQVDAKTVRKWRDRFVAEGPVGLEDRSSRPHRSPNRLPRSCRRQIIRLRTKRRWGADHIADEVGVAASTVQTLLRREGLGRLDRGDRATDCTPVQRYERERPGELVHVDVKKLSGIPDGGGWRIHGRGQAPGRKRSTIGYRFLHTVIDDRTRLAYSEILDDEQGPTAAAFWHRAARLVHRARDHDRTRDHRQRFVLPVLRLARRTRPDQRHPQTHPALPAPDQWQGGALPPDPARGMGLHPRLELRPRTSSRVRRVHAFLQSPPFPRRARMGNTHRDPHPPPRGQPPRGTHLAVRINAAQGKVVVTLSATCGPPHGVPTRPRKRHICRTVASSVHRALDVLDNRPYAPAPSSNEGLS